MRNETVHEDGLFSSSFTCPEPLTQATLIGNRSTSNLRLFAGGVKRIDHPIGSGCVSEIVSIPDDWMTVKQEK